MRRRLIGAALAVLVGACGGVAIEEPPPPQRSIVRVKITGTPRGTGVGQISVRLVAFDSVDVMVQLTGTPRWSSSDSTVAFVDPNGLLTTFRLGAATIRGTMAAQGREFTDSLELIVARAGWP
jgi:hypothetical protein